MAITQTWVIVKSGEKTISRYLLGLGEHLIGRGADCSILVDAEPVSRHHARLVISDDKVILEDLGSANGTYVDDTRIDQPTTLQPHQRIRIGDLELEMIASTDEEFIPTGGHKVFISHAAEDKAVADALCATLEFRSIPCWVAPRDVLPGQDWGTAIIEAINKCRVMIVVFSSHSNHSEHVKREIQNAISAGATIVPLRIEDIPLSPALQYFLGTCHWLDAITPPMEKHLSHLAETVRVVLERGSDPQSRPSLVTGASIEKRILRKILVGAALVGALLVIGGAYLFRHPQLWRTQPVVIASGHADLAAIRAELKALLADEAGGVFADQLRAIEAKLAALGASREPDRQAVLDQLAKELASLRAGPQAGRPFVNSLGMKFVPVPGTDVLFSIWDTRVKDFEAFVKDQAHNGGYDYRKSAVPNVWTPAEGWGRREWKYDWNNPGFAQTPEHPVVCTSWKDAKAFCEWLTAKERREGKISSQHSYSLPTDVEWSCAVGIGQLEGGGTPGEKNGRLKDVYPWGTQWPPPRGAGNYSSIFHVDEYDLGTAPVGSFTANQYGLYDMGGNIGHWCEDWWNPNRKERVLRGMNWGGAFSDVASASGCLLSSGRGSAAPDYRDNFNGFRVVLVGGGMSSTSQPVSAEAFAREVAALSPELQFTRVMQRLEQLNPGLRNVERTTSVKSNDGKVTELDFWVYDSTASNTFAQTVVDLSPIRALVALKKLRIGQTDRRVILTDLSPLSGMQLEFLEIVRATDLSDLRPLNDMPLSNNLSVCDSSVRDLSPLQGMPLTSLWIGNTRVKDLTSLKGMPLTALGCWGTTVHDLTPLTGMQLTHLNLNGSSQVVDLTPLKGMPLAELWCWDLEGLSDLSSLRGIPLTKLYLGRTAVSDLSPLQGMKLLELEIGGTQVKDLSPLKGMPLTWLSGWGTAIHDLAPLIGMPLDFLNINDTQVVDFTPLQGVPLRVLWIDGSRVKDLSQLKGLPLTELGCVRTAVHDLTPLREMRLTTLYITETPVVDLTPLTGMPLGRLCIGKTGVKDLSLLKGMPLTYLECFDTPISDLTPLEGMQLTDLNICGTQVVDLAPLNDNMRLVSLRIAGTRVKDISPLKGMPLTELAINNTHVTNLSPLKEMPLKRLWCDFKPKRHAQILRSIKTLEKINDRPVAEVLKK